MEICQSLGQFGGSLLVNLDHGLEISVELVGRLLLCRSREGSGLLDRGYRLGSV